MHSKYNDSEIFSFITDLNLRSNILRMLTVTYFILYLLCQVRFM